jgi:hypothetical protein
VESAAFGAEVEARRVAMCVVARVAWVALVYPNAPASSFPVLHWVDLGVGRALRYDAGPIVSSQSRLL